MALPKPPPGMICFLEGCSVTREPSSAQPRASNRRLGDLPCVSCSPPRSVSRYSRSGSSWARFGECAITPTRSFASVAAIMQPSPKPGGGKGVSVVIPTCLSHSGSLVITDPMGENATKTARHRQERFGHRIVILSPFAQGSDCYNPLDAIDHTSLDFVDQTKDLAAALIVRTGKEHEAHWLDWAERVIQAVIAFVCVTASDVGMRNLKSVRDIVASREKYLASVQLMQGAGNIAGGVLQHLGHSLTWLQDRELASVLSSVQRMLSFLDSPQISAHVCKSTFSPKELLGGKMSIFLCLPADRLKSHAAIQRLWLTGILRSLTKNTNEYQQTLFLLDEIGNMGHLQILEDAVTMYRKFGVRLHFIFQSLGQVKELFGERANTFMDNIGTQIYFNIASYETAEAISRRCGDSTVTTTSRQEGHSDSQPTGPSGPGSQAGSDSRSRNRTTSQHYPKLMKPEEILTLDPNLCICFHDHHPPIVARLVKYYNSPLFKTWRPGRYRTGASGGLGLRSGVMAVASLIVSFALAFTPAALSRIVVPRMKSIAAGMRQPAAPGQLIGHPYRQIGGGSPRAYRSSGASASSVRPMRYFPAR